MTKTASIVAALMIMGGAAVADTVDFEGYANGDIITGVDLGGVTLTRGANAIKVTSFVPGGGSSLAIRGEPFEGDRYRADFTGLIDSFSVDLGDDLGDADLLIVEAYSATDVLLDSASFSITRFFSGLVTLSVAAAGIDHILFGSDGVFNNSVFADNLSFTPVSPVPLPAGGLLLGGALLGFGAVRRRRKN